MLPTILVVDDDADLRKTLNMLLSGAFTVREAADGKAALKALKAAKPCLMVLDECMPGMDGLEVLKSARQMHPDLIVIMLTGENEMGIAMRALEMGAAMYVTKPYEAEYLREQIERLVLAGTQGGGSKDARPWRVKQS